MLEWVFNNKLIFFLSTGIIWEQTKNTNRFDTMQEYEWMVSKWQKFLCWFFHREVEEEKNLTHQYMQRWPREFISLWTMLHPFFWDESRVEGKKPKLRNFSRRWFLHAHWWVRKSCRYVGGFRVLHRNKFLKFRYVHEFREIQLNFYF